MRQLASSSVFLTIKIVKADLSFNKCNMKVILLWKKFNKTESF